jgi:hypothetical protein
MNTTAAVATILVCFSLGCGGCRDDDALGRERLGVDSAVDRIALAWCDRDVRCGNIGAGKRYATKELCLAHESSKRWARMDARTCGEASSSDRVQACVASIAEDECLDPHDGLDKRQACDPDRLCGAPR